MSTAVRRAVRIAEVRISEKARANVMNALDSDRLTYGRWQQKFEERFAAIHGRRFAVFMNSGTDALRLSLLALKEFLGWRDGSIVAVPAVTFVATYNVVLQAGLTPYLVDIELEHFAMHPARIPHDAVCMIPVHLFGHLVPLSGYRGLKIPMLVDACETAFVDGCADGLVSCFSTYASHLVTTGVGGLATTDDPDLAQIIRSLANHGRDGIYASVDAPLGRREIMEARFNFVRSGYSSRGTEIQAAIGCAELDEWPRNIERRRRNARLLLDGLRGLPLVLPRYALSSSAWMMFPLLTESREARDMLVTALELNGIETRPLLPLTSQPFVRSRWAGSADIEEMLPNAHLCNETGLYVGCHQYLDDADMAYVVGVFRRLYS